VLSEDLGLHLDGTRPQLLGDVEPEAEAVEVGPAADDVIVAELPHQVRERVGRIGDDDDDSLRRDPVYARNDVPVDRRVRRQQTQASCGVGPIHGPARLLVDSGGDEDRRRTGEVLHLSVPEQAERCEEATVLEICHHAFGSRPVDDDLARAPRVRIG